MCDARADEVARIHTFSCKAKSTRGKMNFKFCVPRIDKIFGILGLLDKKDGKIRNC